MLWKFIKEHFSFFWKSWLGGTFVWGYVFFSTPPFLSNFFLSYLLKLIGVAAAGIITGIFVSLGGHVFTRYMKSKTDKIITKLFKYGKRTEESEQGVEGDSKRA